MGPGYQKRLTSLFRFRANISRFCTTPVETILNNLHEMSIRSAATCVLWCVTVVSLDVEANMEYEEKGGVECSLMQFVADCNVHLQVPTFAANAAIL